MFATGSSSRVTSTKHFGAVSPDARCVRAVPADRVLAVGSALPRADRVLRLREAAGDAVVAGIAEFGAVGLERATEVRRVVDAVGRGLRVVAVAAAVAGERVVL